MVAPYRVYWMEECLPPHDFEGFGRLREAIKSTRIVTMATVNAPWSEMFMPAPGGPPEIYRRFEEDNQVTRGPEGICMRPSDRPGFGWEIEVA